MPTLINTPCTRITRKKHGEYSQFKDQYTATRTKKSRFDSEYVKLRASSPKRPERLWDPHRTLS